MPNHIQNELTVEGANWRAVFDHMETEKSKFDFNKIAQMPKAMDSETGGYGLHTARAAKDAGEGNFRPSYWIREHKIGPESIDEFWRMYECMVHYGATDGLDWARKNWGTKWGEYSVEYSGTQSIRFQTAWSAPRRAILTLSEMFKDCTFTLRFADEDYGSNLGILTYEAGGLSKVWIPKEGECTKFAYSVHRLGKEEIAELEAEE